MHWYACAPVAAGYCVLVHARVCSVQRILPHSWCGLMQDVAHRRVKHSNGFGNCIVVFWQAGAGKLNGRNIV